MTTSPPVREASCAAVWAPWLAAPLFALLPIGGCGLAGLSTPIVAGLTSARPHSVAAAPAAVMPAAAPRLARGG
ncbi:MAG: hypothetical protein ACKOZU_08375 [Planctomycetaceae bacterium]